MANTLDVLIGRDGFFPVPPQRTIGTTQVSSPKCEDFDEHTKCSLSNANNDACVNNADGTAGGAKAALGITW